MRGERIAAPLLALLIVFSGAGGAIAPGASPVGTAQAQDGVGGTCGTADWALSLIVGPLASLGCSTGEEVAEEWNETDAIQTRTQIHSQAGQLQAGNEQFLVGMENALTDSNTIAFSKGEAAAVETLANGGTVAEAQAAANESIEDYYAVKQLNILDRGSVSLETIRTLDQRAENTTGVDNDFVTLGGPDDFGDSWDENNPNSNGQLTIIDTYDAADADYQITTLNGTTKTTAALRWQIDSNDARIGLTGGIGEAGSDYKANEPFTLGTEYIDSQGWVRGSHVKVRSTSDLNSKTAMDIKAFYDAYKQVEQRSNATKKEVAVYVEKSLGPAVQNGELNATSYVSPATLAQEYAQSYNGSESYIRATAIASFSGMDAPDLNETGSMTVTHDGKTYEGLLLSQEGPSGGWQSGETYDPALLSGLQMIAVAGDNSSIVELDGPFTIDSIQGTTGEQIETARTVNVTYETANTSEDYAELQQQIRSLNEQIEERQAQATSGGSGTGSSGDILSKLAALLGVSSGVAVVIVAGVAFVAYRIYVPGK